MRRVANTLPLAAVALAACAIGDPAPAAPDAATPDASTVADAQPEREPDAEPVACSVRPFTDFGTHPGHALATAYDEASKEWRITFDVDAAGDYGASIVLREGVGLFETGVKQGKYDIFGADTRYESCSLCVSVKSREGALENGEVHEFQAARGTLHIESLDAEARTISGYLVGAELEPFELSEKNGPYCDEDSDCGRTWCGLLACTIQEPRPELCGFSIGRLNF